jgi:hypothetical protein
MGLYRRLARSKKGMSTIFGALFFVILILMGFNLMLWVFIQQDAYNSVISNMQQADQAAISENLVPQQPGAQNFTGSTGICAGCGFNIPVNNNGGSAVIITRIYIIQCTGSAQCPGGTSTSLCSGTGAPCILNPSGTTADPSCSICSFSNGNVPPGVTRQLIPVSGVNINDGGVYRVIITSTRGRQASYAFPWQAPPVVIINNAANVFTLNIGPVSISFDFKSFNFTRGSQTQSQPAWVLPDKTQIVLWIKVQSIVDNNVTIARQSGILLQQYTGSNAGSTAMFIVDPNSVCPNPQGNPPNCQGILRYTTAMQLPRASGAGPGSSVILKFAATCESSYPAAAASCESTPSAINQDGTFLAFIGLFYYITINGVTQFQGETVPFVATNVCASYPLPC